jgi:signal transduction histidine kinase
VSGLDQLQYLSWLLYLLIFGAVFVRTLRRPIPAHVDMTLFFGAVAVVIVLTTFTSKLHLASDPPWLGNDLVGVAAVSLGYLLLRLVRDFSQVPLLVMRSVEAGALACVVAILASPGQLPELVGLFVVAYLAIVIAYDTWAFATQSTRVQGVTRRRMQAAALGSLCLTLALVVSDVTVALPAQVGFWQELGGALGLASGVSYFVGFAPPTWLRRAWQEPELRAFLARATTLPRLVDKRAMVSALEQGAASALGAPAANIALWDADSGRLEVYLQPPGPGTVGTAPSGWTRADVKDGVLVVDPHTHPVTGRAFVEQHAVLIADTAKADPAHASTFEAYATRAVLSAPITIGETRLGVLVVYAPRAPVFANSDLELVQLLADQAAVVLESRALIDEAGNVRAREEAARLKEDFLSSAAHDLKTPLTGLVAQAQVLMRRADRDPAAPPDRAGLNRLLEQSLRLKDLVLELLDVSRLDQGSLLGQRTKVDLRDLLRTLLVRQDQAWRRVTLEADQPVHASVDPPRFEQVLTNLVENALKYSPHDTSVRVRLERVADEACISVQDHGIGIPKADQPLVFDRFHRARNVDDRRFAGMGLGLYIARGIVEQHGGRIWVDSTAQVGSTFFVTLPVVARESQPDADLIVEPDLANA